MKEWIVEVRRTASDTREITVEAEDERTARNIAVNTADEEPLDDLDMEIEVLSVKMVRDLEEEPAPEPDLRMPKVIQLEKEVIAGKQELRTVWQDT